MADNLPDAPWISTAAAAAGANLPDAPWANAPAASAAPSVPADMAFSALAGARDAPIAAVTAPRSIGDLLSHGVGKLIHWAVPEGSMDLLWQGGEAHHAKDPAALQAMLDQNPNASPYVRNMLGAQLRDLQKSPDTLTKIGNALEAPQSFGGLSNLVSSAGIPDYESQTKGGEYTKSIATLAPMALTGNESWLMNLFKGAVAPGAGSQYLGDRFAGTWAETPARLIGALAGGAGAHGVDVAQNAVRKIGAQGTAAAEASQIVGAPVNRGAITRVAQDVRNDQLTPAIAQARMAELGNEGMMLDAGRQLQGRAEAIATQPGAGQNAVLDAVENRTGDFGANTAARIKDTLDTHMGQSPDVVDLTNRVSGIVDSMAKPLYDKVMGDHPVVHVPDEITSRPAVASAMGNATTLARQYGEKLESPIETNTIIAGPGYHIAEDTTAPAQTSLRYWDYVKKDLDRRINSYMKSGGTSELNNADKADLGGLINARNALRDHLDDVTGGDYAAARKVAAQKPELIDALEQGKNALNTKLLPEEMNEVYSNLSMPQQAMYRAGVRREVDRVIDTARNDGAAARKILDTNQNREKIASMFGGDAAQALDNRIAAETKFQNATNDIARNSRTGVRSQLVKDTESPSAAAPPQANIMGFAHKALTGALQGMRDTGMQNTRAAIGSMMTTPANKVPDLVRVLANYNAKAAQAARPPLAPYLSTLGRTLAINQIQRAQEGQQRQQ